MRRQLDKAVAKLYSYFSTPAFLCSRCGGANIQAQVWANPNQGYHVPASDREEWALNDVWCHDCEDHVEVTEL